MGCKCFFCCEFPCYQYKGEVADSSKPDTNSSGGGGSEAGSVDSVDLGKRPLLTAEASARHHDATVAIAVDANAAKRTEVVVPFEHRKGQ